MRTNELTFSRSGGADRLYRVDPLLFAQTELNNQYFLPDERELPSEGLELRFWTFDFGFAVPANVIAPYQMGVLGLLAGRNFLGMSITGASVPTPSATPPATTALITGTPPGAQITPAFQVNFIHTHQGAQRQWINKNGLDVQMVGRGIYPKMEKNPPLILQGDTLTCQVVNLGNSNLQVQIMIAGGEF